MSTIVVIVVIVGPARSLPEQTTLVTHQIVTSLYPCTSHAPTLDIELIWDFVFIFCIYVNSASIDSREKLSLSTFPMIPNQSEDIAIDPNRPTVW